MIKIGKCGFCGKPFPITSGRQSKKKWCSPKCSSKAWAKSNPESRRKHWRKYLDSHRKEQRERSRDNYWMNREKILAYNHQQENREENNARTRAKVVMKDVPRICTVCGSTDNVHIHHIDFDPLNNSRDNLQYLCSLCHGIKHRELNNSVR